MPQFSLQSVLVIFAIVLSNLGFALWCFSWPGVVKRVREWITFNAIRTGVFLFAASICIWVGIFVVYDFPVTGDVTLFFQPEGRAAMSGAIPTVDFHSSYMPLFTYVLGLADLLWPDNRAIPLLWTLLLATAGLLLRQVLVAGGEKPALASAFVIAGVLNGATWFLTIGCQQDEPLLVLFAVLAMLFVLQNREIAGGATLAIGLLTTKVLFLIPASVILIQSRKISRTLLGFILCFVPIMAVFLSLGFDPVRMIGTEPERFHPPSLTNLVAAIPSVYGAMKSSPWIGHFVAVIVWSFSLIYFMSRGETANLKRMIPALMAAWLGFLIFSPKSFTFYRIVILPFFPVLLLNIVPYRKWMIVWFCFYNTVLGIQYMLREDWISGHGNYTRFFTQHVNNPELFGPFLVVIFLDLIIVSSEILWLWVCFKSRRQSTIS